MKIFLSTLTIIICSFNYQAQVLNYTDLGILLSTENATGTARFSALNGSMGAIGGDLSAAQINPAGGAIFNQNEFSTTLDFKNNRNTTTYFGNETKNEDTNSNLNQIGGVFIFNSTNRKWNKTALILNYQVNSDFKEQNIFEGNSGFASFNTHPNDSGNEYNNAQNQTFENSTDGKTAQFSVLLAGQYNEKTYFGGGINFHILDFSQTLRLNEQNLDSNNNQLNGQSIQENTQSANGISLTMGTILKPLPQLRFGFSFQSPIWYYRATEEFNEIENISAIASRAIPAAPTLNNDSFFEYKLSTPYNITASTAIVLGRIGFINIDYTYKGYSSLELDSNNDSNLFTAENQYFNDVLQNTNNIKIGGEFRLGKLSFRGGLGYEQSPFKDNVNPLAVDVLKLGDKYSGSVGLGYRLGNSKIDIAYRKTKQENEYDFYDSQNNIDTTPIDNKNSNLTMSYTYLF